MSGDTIEACAPAVTEITYWRMATNRVGMPDDRADPIYRYAYRTVDAALDALEVWLRERLPDGGTLHHEPIGDFYTRTDFPSNKGKPKQEFRVLRWTLTRAPDRLILRSWWESRWTGTRTEKVAGEIDGVPVAGQRSVVAVLRDWTPWVASWAKTHDDSATGWSFEPVETTIRLEWAP